MTAVPGPHHRLAIALAISYEFLAIRPVVGEYTEHLVNKHVSGTQWVL